MSRYAAQWRYASAHGGLERTLTPGVIGTAAYAAPELLSPATPDSASDCQPTAEDEARTLKAGAWWGREPDKGMRPGGQGCVGISLRVTPCCQAPLVSLLLPHPPPPASSRRLLAGRVFVGGDGAAPPLCRPGLLSDPNAGARLRVWQG